MPNCPPGEEPFPDTQPDIAPCRSLGSLVPFPASPDTFQNTAMENPHIYPNIQHPCNSKGNGRKTPPPNCPTTSSSTETPRIRAQTYQYHDFQRSNLEASLVHLQRQAAEPLLQQSPGLFPCWTSAVITGSLLPTAVIEECFLILIPFYRIAPFTKHVPMRGPHNKAP